MKLLNHNFLVRTVSAAVFVIIIVGASLLSIWSFLALLVVIMCGSMVELNRMARQAGYQPAVWYPLAAGLFFFAVVASSAIWDCIYSFPFMITEAIPLLPFLLPIAFIVELFRNNPAPIANAGINMLSLVYIALPLLLLTFMPILGGEFNGLHFLYYIFMVWANDVGAYIFGATLGRHKLMERISPKKSWEGFFGGILLAMAVGAIIGGVVVESKTALWMGAGLVIAVTSVLGDLVESMFKRSAGVKDSGAIMPGHGGFLDRFDSVFISAPFAVAYFILFDVI